MRKYIKVTLAITAGFIALTLGHGCTPSEDAETLQSVSGTAGTQNDPGETGPIENAKTVSLVYSAQIVDHFVGCLGTGKASDRTIQMYEDKKSSISEFGGTNSLTAPMLMAVISIAAEVCQDLYEQENALAAASRRIYTGIDLASSALANDTLLGDSMRRLARSCWKRNETDAERSMMLAQLPVTFPTGTAGTNNRNAMLFMCTSVMTSIDALTL